MKKTSLTRRQRDAVRRQRAHGDDLRAWLHDREQAVQKRLSELRKALFNRRQKGKAPSRGVDRVPDRYRVKAPEPTVIVEHHDLVRSYRRARGYTATSGNTPHVNPERDAKSARSGRLRKELR